MALSCVESIERTMDAERIQIARPLAVAVVKMDTDFEVGEHSVHVLKQEPFRRVGFRVSGLLSFLCQVPINISTQLRHPTFVYASHQCPRKTNLKCHRPGMLH